MKIIRELINAIRARGPVRTITIFPKGTIVHYQGIPCQLLEDCMYYSATIQPQEKMPEAKGVEN